MELGEWIGGRIIENLNRRSDNRGSTVIITLSGTVSTTDSIKIH